MKNKKIICSILIEFIIAGIGVIFLCVNLFSTSDIPPEVFLKKLSLVVVYCMGYGLFIKVIRGYYDTIIQICYCKKNGIQIRAYAFYPFFKEKDRKIKLLKFPDYFNSNLEISIQECVESNMDYHYNYKEIICKVQNVVLYANIILILICLICIPIIQLYWLTPIIAISISRVFFLTNNETILGEKGFDLYGDNKILEFRSGINFLSTTNEAKMSIYSSIKNIKYLNTNLRNYYEYQFLTEALLDAICENIEYIHESKWKGIIDVIKNQNIDDIFRYLPVLRLYAIKIFIKGKMDEYDKMLVIYRKSMAILICSTDIENELAISIAQNQLDELIQKKEIQLLAYEMDNPYRYYEAFQKKRKIVEELYKNRALCLKDK